MSSIRAIAAMAIAQLRHDQMRTVLAILGVAIAVVATTVLASVGIGVIQTGEEKFDAAGRDLWITGGAIELAPGTVGGFQNTVVDAHEVAADIEADEDVKNAIPMAFQVVYVSPNQSSYSTMVASGAPARGNSVRIVEGSGFQRPDVHYAGGNYTGPMTHEVVIDRGTANRFDVGINDSLYIGGTLASARANEFRVVGISPTFTQFLGTSTVTLHLSELQSITGGAASDRATLISVSLEDDADVNTVEERLQQAYPRYSVNTNREQLRQIVERQAVVIGSGISLILLAVLGGLALTVNLQLSHVIHQRSSFAALGAIGVSDRTLTRLIVVQSVVIGIIGGLVGIALTPLLAFGLNELAIAIVGFNRIVRTPLWLYGLGFSVALGMSILSGFIAGRRLRAQSVLDGLRQ